MTAKNGVSFIKILGKERYVMSLFSVLPFSTNYIPPTPISLKDTPYHHLVRMFNCFDSVFRIVVVWPLGPPHFPSACINHSEYAFITKHKLPPLLSRPYHIFLCKINPIRLHGLRHAEMASLQHAQRKVLVHLSVDVELSSETFCSSSKFSCFNSFAVGWVFHYCSLHNDISSQKKKSDIVVQSLSS